MNRNLSYLRDLPETVGTYTSNGRTFWLYSDGTSLPVIQGGDGSTENDGENGGTGGSGGNGNTGSTFTQEDLNRIAAREKDEGKRAALSEVAKTLGCTVEEAADIIKRSKEADDAQKTEAQRAKEAAERAKAEADEEKAQAAREKHIVRVERALLKAGVPDAKIERVARMMDVEVGAEPEKLDEAAKALKKDFPELFATGSGGTNDSDPPGSPPKPKIKDDKFNAGAERAKQYAASTFGTKEN